MTVTPAPAPGPSETTLPDGSKVTVTPATPSGPPTNGQIMTQVGGAIAGSFFGMPPALGMILVNGIAGTVAALAGKKKTA